MKRINKTDFNSTLLKGLISKFIFTMIYIFVYSLIMGSARPLSFIADKGFVHTYLLIEMLLGALPFIFCGYIIMVGRNRREDLERKNLVLALVIFGISFLTYLGVTILQSIFEYRSIYDFFILLNYPLLRETQYLELSRLQINMMMLISTFIPSLFIYLGGRLRLNAIKKGD